ncbi:hypothetical protein AC249_AIPGENE22011 [Exaiptasia diaphana]|nr:hypothetical protein AC249_AIPGENE22011 [Exaiptasia diaphana]
MAGQHDLNNNAVYINVRDFGSRLSETRCSPTTGPASESRALVYKCNMSYGTVCRTVDTAGYYHHRGSIQGVT